MSRTISFRLNDHYPAELNALTRKGESVYEWVMQILIRALDGVMNEGGSRLSEKFDALVSDFALTTEAILISAGKYPKEQARE
jgi:hypothetical protein